MFIALLAATFVIATLVTAIVALGFRHSIGTMLHEVFPAEVVTAWQRYMSYVIYVVGISGGVRIWQLERYIDPQTHLVLNRDRWVLEVYRTLVGSLQSTAWLLFAFFLIAIVAFAVVRFVKREAT